MQGALHPVLQTEGLSIMKGIADCAPTWQRGQKTSINQTHNFIDIKIGGPNLLSLQLETQVSQGWSLAFTAYP